MRSLVAIALMLLLLVLPVQCLVLPLNMAAIDLASFAVLPLCWIWFGRGQVAVQLPFLPAFLLILSATAAASLVSLDPADSATVLIKETYLFVWFATIATALAAFGERHRRLFLCGWLIAALGNGALILAQFAHPPLLATMNALLAGNGNLDPYRPSGLFENCNSAALFQVSAFAPLLALRWPARRTVPVLLTLLAMMLGTGSMGALLAFAAGAATLMVCLLLRREWALAARITAIALLAGAAFAFLLTALVAAMPSLAERVEYVMTGRSGYSAESRFGIWTRGADAVLGDWSWLGVGPDMWKRIDGHELHNDGLSFAIERGVLALLGLLTLTGMAMRDAALLVRRGDAAWLGVPAALVAVATMSLTHEVFHQRPLWLLLALLVALRAQSLGAVRAAPAVPATVPSAPIAFADAAPTIGR